MKSMNKFYDKYWMYRKRIGKYTPKKRTPNRMHKTMELINFDNDLKILDVGCGDGAIGRLIKNKKINLVGVDISKEAIKLSRNYYNQTKVFDIEEDNFPKKWENSYDYIICIEVLEHLFNPKEALLEMKKLLKQDGTLIVSFPNMAWWKYRLKLLRGEYPEESRLYKMVEHLQNFTLKSFKKLIEETGYGIIDINPDYGRVPLPFYILPKKLRERILGLLPNLFGYQIIISLKKSSKISHE